MIKPKTLETRKGLPDALRVLIEDYPRDIWEEHTNFDGLTRFWLSRHLEFRKALDLMRQDTQAVLDKTEDPQLLIHRTTRIGSFLIDALHGHHYMEDTQYFPLFIDREPRLSAGFEILDSDHHELDAHLDRMGTELTNLSQGFDPADPTKLVGGLHERLSAFETFLNRHLMDEEELVVPIILKYGPPHP